MLVSILFQNCIHQNWMFHHIFEGFKLKRNISDLFHCFLSYSTEYNNRNNRNLTWRLLKELFSLLSLWHCCSLPLLMLVSWKPIAQKIMFNWKFRFILIILLRDNLGMYMAMFRLQYLHCSSSIEWRSYRLWIFSSWMWLQ